VTGSNVQPDRQSSRSDINLPLFDPRRGDVEDDASSPKQRSLVAITGSLLAEISLPKLVFAWTFSILLPAVLLGLAPLVATAWIQKVSRTVAEVTGLGAVLILLIVIGLGLIGWRPLLRTAENNFWSLNALAVQPGYALCREALRHLTELAISEDSGIVDRARLGAISCAGAGIILFVCGGLIAIAIWPASHWVASAPDLIALHRLILPTLANAVVVISAYFAGASLVWGLADASMEQPVDMNTPDLVGECGYVFADFPNLFLPDRLWMTIIRSESDICVRWLSYLLSSRPYKTRMKGLATGTSGSMKNIAKNALLAMPIAYPDSVEQCAIANAVSDVDALLRGLDRSIAKNRDLKQATIQQLLTGRIRLPGFEGEWRETKLGDCLHARPYYGINASAVPYSDSLPTYLRITDISEDGRFRPDPRVSVKAASAKQFYLQCGDIVFARTGGSVGKSYLYNPQDGQLVFAGFLIRVRPNPEKLHPAFLSAYATTQMYWNWVRLMSMRSGQPGINGNEYAQMPLFLPHVSEQAAIAEVLTDIDAEFAAMEQRREKTHALKQGMMQELLTGKIRLV
jgi:type I restriction enzyme, S subunit